MTRGAAVLKALRDANPTALTSREIADRSGTGIKAVREALRGLLLGGLIERRTRWVSRFGYTRVYGFPRGEKERAL